MINIFAVIVIAIIYWILGAIWYSKILFGNMWMESIGKTEDELEKIRRKYYGQAGTYRIQPHGIEYRTPSGYWMTSPALTSLVTGLMRDAFTITYSDNEDYFLDKVNTKNIRNIINECDYKKAKGVYYDLLKPFYVKFKKDIGRSPMKFKYTLKVIDYLVDNGYESVFDPYKMLVYWGLTNYRTAFTWYPWRYGINAFSKDIRDKKFTYEEIRNPEILQKRILGSDK